MLIMPNKPEAYAAHNAAYDTIMAQGDHSPAQQSRLAIALYAMVCTGGDSYGSTDYRNYKRQAYNGAYYLTYHGLDITPSDLELAELSA